MQVKVLYLSFFLLSFQFYLEDNILKVTALNTSWPLKNRDVLNWSDVDSLHGGDPASLEGSVFTVVELYEKN